MRGPLVPLLLGLCLGACASAGPGPPNAASSDVSQIGQSFRRLLAPAEEGARAWMLPEGSFPSQRLYRVSYDGPEGKVGFRLTLYLASREHYRMDAADTLGRRVWSLAVEPGGEALWLDHRQRRYCATRGAREQTFVPIAHLPLEALPRLILGRMPALPAGEVLEGGGKIAYRDSRGQEWNGMLENGSLAWWSLLRDGEAVAWWRNHEGENIFSDRRGGQQVRWTEQVRELLETPLSGLEVPEKYREGACGTQLGTPASPR